MRRVRSTYSYIPAVLFLIMAVLLFVAGALLGQPQMVMNKGIRICLECIGIG